MIDLVIATGNRHKFRELVELLRVPGVRWHSLAAVHPPLRIRETGRTFEANAIAKARAAANTSGWWAVADDSGIEVAALGGQPGVRSARYAGRHGDDAANNAKLLRALRGVRQAARRAARYRCVLALASPARLLAVARGHWSGRIAFEPKGSGGFGYDPLVVIPRFGKTVAQLPRRVKQRHSHRAMAARRLRPLLRVWVRRASGSAASRRVLAGRRRGLARTA